MVPGTRLVLLGKQGAGKGTQAVRLARHYAVPHISTGDMFRAAVRSGSEFGAKARKFMDAGDLVPDDVVIGLVRERIALPDAAKGFLLDGFPRTIEQAEALDRILRGNAAPLDGVINLLVPEGTLLERLLGRAALEGRSDDRRETVAERLRIYREKTAPLVQHYRDLGLLTDVDGSGSIDEVAGRIDRALVRPARAAGRA